MYKPYFFLIHKSGIGLLGSAQAENVCPEALYLINVSCSSKTTNKGHFSSKVMNVEPRIPSTSPQISLRNEDISGAFLSQVTGFAVPQSEKQSPSGPSNQEQLVAR